jgi:hypothetical protein
MTSSQKVTNTRAGRTAQVVEHLPTKHKVLSSTPSVEREKIPLKEQII